MGNSAYTYARSDNGTRRYLLYTELASELYTAILDVAQQRAVPIGIRQGRGVLYRHSQLVALHAQFVDQLRRSRPLDGRAGARGPSAAPVVNGGCDQLASLP